MTHYQKLQNMYLSGPINQATYPSVQIEVSEGQAIMSLEVQPEYFHAGQSLHGSVYFKMLDDAAYFAVNSVVTDAFVYTVAFNIQILRPVKSGRIKAVGTLKFASKNLWVADAVLYDAKGREVARGSGNFMKSALLLESVEGYQ
jgi:uncharacterized protein (TIGR00369 family)